VACSKTFVSQRIFPSVAPTQTTWQLLPASVADVRKTLSPTTIGDDQPSPGIAVFHATFVVADHSSGRPVSGEWPWPSGPRKRGQSWAQRSRRTAAMVFIWA